MANFNRIVLLGNLTRDPQLKYLPSQMAVAEFGLAVNHKFKGRDGQDREEILFIDCSIFGKGAEIINQYVQKGRPLLVEGRLKYDTWEDKQGGGKRSKHSVVVENFQLLGSRGDSAGAPGGGGNEEGSAAPRQNRPPQGRPPQRPPQAQRGAAPQQNAPEPPFGDEPQFTDDDIPF
jgi:single-strand DNA-binding protein